MSSIWMYNPAADNYDPLADTDDGSCTYCTLDQVTLNLYDAFGDGWNGAFFTINGVDYTVTGSSASFDLCIDLSTCTDMIWTSGSWGFRMFMDATDASGAVIGSGGSGSATLGNCFVQVDGCTDPTACNYDPLANTDDGSCAVVVNYN